MSMDFNLDPKLVKQLAESLAQDHLQKAAGRRGPGGGPNGVPIPPGAEPTANLNARAKEARQQLAGVLKNALDVKCEKCESTTFEQVWMVKRVSALASPTGSEATLPIQSFRCSECKHINAEFTPEQMVNQ